MADLIVKFACEGLLPLQIGELNLREVLPEYVTVLAPFKGQQHAVSAALKKAHGIELPAVNRAVGKEALRVVWFSQGKWAVLGPDLGVKFKFGISKMAALLDQSDAWAVVRLDGAAAEQVLARLVPVDLRQPVFKRGHTLRTDLSHMMASITRIGDKSFQIMVFRSMAETLLHELQTAMENVTARQAVHRFGY